MSSLQALCLAAALCALLLARGSFASNQLAGGATTADGRPILSIEVDGHLITVPAYEKDTKPFSERRLAFDRQTSVDVGDLMRELMVGLVKERRSALLFGLPVVTRMLFMARAKSVEMNRLSTVDTSPPIPASFLREMGQLLSDLCAMKSRVKLTKDECYRRIDIMLTAERELVAESPYGLYMAWRELEVDGVPMMDYCAPVVQWFQDHRYGVALYGGRQMAGLLKKAASN